MATKSWSNPVNGSCTVGSNWSSDSVRGASDEALIDVSGNHTVSLNVPITVQSIGISDTSATLCIRDPGGTESVTAGLINAGVLDLDAFRRDGSTTPAVGGTLTHSGQLVRA
jgi:hypothetical protein